MKKHTFRLAALAGIVVLANCTDSPTAPDAEVEKPLGASEIRPTLVIPPGAPAIGSNIVVTFLLRRGASAPKIGSFGAAITYDATALEFVSGQIATDGVV